MAESIKVSFNIPKSEYEALKKYAKNMNISVTDALRHGAALVIFITKEARENRIVLEDKGRSGNRKEVVLPWPIG